MDFFWSCTPDLDSVGPCALVPLRWLRDEYGFIIIICNQCPEA